MVSSFVRSMKYFKGAFATETVAVVVASISLYIAFTATSIFLPTTVNVEGSNVHATSAVTLAVLSSS